MGRKIKNYNLTPEAFADLGKMSAAVWGSKHGYTEATAHRIRERLGVPPARVWSKRPTKSRAETIRLRCYAGQKKLWKAEATKRGYNLSAWIESLVAAALQQR